MSYFELVFLIKAGDMVLASQDVCTYPNEVANLRNALDWTMKNDGTRVNQLTMCSYPKKATSNPYDPESVSGKRALTYDSEISSLSGDGDDESVNKKQKKGNNKKRAAASSDLNNPHKKGKYGEEENGTDQEDDVASIVCKRLDDRFSKVGKGYKTWKEFYKDNIDHRIPFHVFTEIR